MRSNLEYHSWQLLPRLFISFHLWDDHYVCLPISGSTMTLEQLCSELESEILKAYEESITLDDAERLAARFLYGQIQVSNSLKEADLDARMRKSGVKAVRAAVYLKAVTGSEKKPTEAMLESTINTDGTVSTEQDGLDTAEANVAHLTRYYNIFREAHIHFRGLAKGKFE